MLEMQNHTTVIPFCVKGKNYKINFIPEHSDFSSFKCEITGASVPKTTLDRFSNVASMVFEASDNGFLNMFFSHPDPLVRYVATATYLLINQPQGRA